LGSARREYVIRLAEAPTDLAPIEHRLLDLDPAALLDRDAATGVLRCSTSATAVELLHTLADAGYRVSNACHRRAAAAAADARSSRPVCATGYAAVRCGAETAIVSRANIQASTA
jgi:hypothetical protein